MTDDAPQSVTGCPDQGTCHHHCLTGCWRVATCSPMTAYGETWTRADRKTYGNVVQDWPQTPAAAQSAAAEVHWGGQQGRILRYLNDFVMEHGYPPSMAQIGQAVGLTSTSSVSHQLQVLEHRGHIKREPGRPRAITILTHPDTPVEYEYVLVVDEHGMVGTGPTTDLRAVEQDREAWLDDAGKAGTIMRRKVSEWETM